MGIPTYNVSTLAKLQLKEMMALPEGRHTLIFDDGSELKTTYRRTLFSWFFWRMHTTYPGAKITQKHHVGNGRMTKGREIVIASNVIWDVWDAFDGPEDKIWPMARTIYLILNDIHNFTIGQLGEYVTSVDLEDIYQLGYHPGIKQLKEAALKEEMSIEDIHHEIMKIMNSNDPLLRYNGIAMMNRAALLSPNQLVQFIGPRGYVNGADGNKFKEPINVGYIDGMTKLYDSAIESRSSSTSLYMIEGPLQDSEYFNRQMQLFTAVIQGVKGDDCGTQHTLEWLVTEGDLGSLDGKYHMVKGVPVLFNKTDTQYIGTVIKLRSITCCQNVETTTVCKTCLGIAHRILPSRTNLGYILTIEPLSAISQLILSTKHVLASMASLYLELTPETAGWLRLDRSDKSSVCLKKSCASNNYILRVKVDEVKGLNNIKRCQDPGSLEPQRISYIGEICIAVADREGKRRGEWSYINTIVGGGGSALSSDVIMAIHDNGFTSVEDMIEIPLKGFKGKELFITPRRNEDMMTYLKSVKHFVFGSEKSGESVMSYKNVTQAVAGLKRIFDEKINVNMIHVEIFIRAAMTVNYMVNDYRLPRGGEPFKFCAARSIISNRSVSAGLAYQQQSILLTKPSTYLKGGKREDHILDAIYG